MSDPKTPRVGERILALRSHLEEHPGIQEIPVLGELATLLFGTRQFEEAASLFSRASELAPGSAELLNNLAACYLELERYDDVIETASKALRLDPALGAAFANRADANRKLGQLRRAAEDYHKAVQLDQANPVLLNKTGANLQLLRQYDAARKHFEAALAASPRFSLARLNLGLLGLEMEGGSKARQLIQEAVVDRRLDPESRHIGNTALAILKDHDRRAPQLEQALETNDLAGLTTAASGTTETLLLPDREAIPLLQELAESCSKLEWSDRQFRFIGDTNHLPFLEAAANCNLDPHADSLRIVLRSLQDGGQLPPDAVHRNLPGVLRAIQDRTELEMEARFTSQGEAWMHYWHARLMQQDQSAFPGQYKPTPGAVESVSPGSATPPGNVAGTMRFVLDRLSQDVPAGVPRAVFLLTALLRVQPFKDGNGRLARFICSWQLESHGLHPVIVTTQARQNFLKGLTRAWAEKSTQPVLDSLASAHKNAQQLLNEFNRVLASAL